MFGEIVLRLWSLIIINAAGRPVCSHTTDFNDINVAHSTLFTETLQEDP